MKKDQITDNEEVLNLIYDFILETDISERERKIGYMAKADLEHKKYLVFVLNKICASLQQEAVRNRGLSKKADIFYKKINDLLVKNKPFGTNVGSFMMQVGYLD